MAVRKAKRRVYFNLIFGLVLSVLTLSFGLPELNGGKPFLPYGFVYVILNTVFINNFLLHKARALLLFKNKQQPVVYNCLPFKGVKEILGGNINVGKNLNIGLPAGLSARVLTVVGLFFKPAHVIALFKVQVIFKPVALYFHVHIFRGILRRTKT